LDIVIATPGRLIDQLNNAPNFSLLDVEVLVLDEVGHFGKFKRLNILG
jgi:superfamily II DNA/RNA helicase